MTCDLIICTAGQGQPTSVRWWGLEHSSRRGARARGLPTRRVYTLIFSALGFMLVFRLTRAAIRYWDCRAAWGTIAMEGMEGGRVVGKLGGRAAQQVQLTTIY